MTKKSWDFNKNVTKTKTNKTISKRFFGQKKFPPPKTQLSVFFLEFSFEFGESNSPKQRDGWSCVFVKAEGAQNAQCDGAQFESQAV